MNRGTDSGPSEDPRPLLYTGLSSFASACSRDAGVYYQRFNAHEGAMGRAEVDEKFRFLRYLLSPVPVDARVLETGSGFGLNLIVLSLLGYRDVRGIEIVPELHETSASLIDHLRGSHGLELDGVSVTCGDAQFTDLPSGSFDCILSVEVVSHFPSLDAFLREANRLLRPGGLLVISDGTNITCSRYRRRISEAWARVRREEMERRLTFIAERRPDLDPQLRASIALHTEMLPRHGLEEVLDSIAETRRLPMNLWSEGQAPVYFQTGIWAERGFHLHSFEKLLSQYGFSPRVRISAGAARGRTYKLLEDAVNLLPRAIKYRMHQVYRCWARKVSGCRYLVECDGEV
jgi:SAM-dependent methyltransferase